MKKLLKFVLYGFVILIGLLIALPLIFPQTPRTRITYEMDFSINPGGAGQLKSNAEINDCDLITSTTLTNEDGEIIHGRTIFVSLFDVDAYDIGVASGQATLHMINGKTASCERPDGSECAEPNPTEIILPMPKMTTEAQQDRMRGFLSELLTECRAL